MQKVVVRVLDRMSYSIFLFIEVWQLNYSSLCVLLICMKKHIIGYKAKCANMTQCQYRIIRKKIHFTCHCSENLMLYCHCDVIWLVTNVVHGKRNRGPWQPRSQWSFEYPIKKLCSDATFCSEILMKIAKVYLYETQLGINLLESFINSIHARA